jgi:hypothetical protein
VTREQVNANLLKSKSVADFAPEDVGVEPEPGG